MNQPTKLELLAIVHPEISYMLADNKQLREDNARLKLNAWGHENFEQLYEREKYEHDCTKVDLRLLRKRFDILAERIRQYEMEPEKETW